MNPKALLLIAAAVTAIAATSHAEPGTSLDDPSFDTMPKAGISIHKSPEAEQALVVETVSDNPHEGSGCLKISLPVAAYASVSFPLRQESQAMDIEFAYRVEASPEAVVKIGVQSFTMAGGFRSVDFKPVVAPGQYGPEWKVFRGRIERAEGATHWQLSVAINGPATVWLDRLEAQPQ